MTAERFRVHSSKKGAGKGGITALYLTEVAVLVGVVPC